MNTGLSLARGRYVYYLNAGDLLTDPQVLADLKQLNPRDIDPVWVVGRVEISESEWQHSTQQELGLSR